MYLYKYFYITLILYKGIILINALFILNGNGIENCIEPLSMKMLSVLFLSMRRYRVIDIEARPKIEELKVIEKELRSMLRHMHYSISFEH